MRRCLPWILSLLACVSGQAMADDEDYLLVTIQDPFIELHTGPGRGYPVFYIAERGEQIEVMARRTDWFRVRVPRGKEGWVNLEQLQRTLQIDGNEFVVPELSVADYIKRRWEAGVLYGDFGGANVNTAFVAYGFTDNLSLELVTSEALGRYADSQLTSINMLHTMFPDHRVSPYFALGTGSIQTSPKTTLVQSPDRRDSFARVGAGVRLYLTRQFVFRAEWSSYVVFTSRDENEDTREWKAGFSFFF